MKKAWPRLNHDGHCMMFCAARLGLRRCFVERRDGEGSSFCGHAERCAVLRAIFNFSASLGLADCQGGFKDAAQLPQAGRTTYSDTWFAAEGSVRACVQGRTLHRRSDGQHGPGAPGGATSGQAACWLPLRPVIHSLRTDLTWRLTRTGHYRPQAWSSAARHTFYPSCWVRAVVVYCVRIGTGYSGTAPLQRENSEPSFLRPAPHYLALLFGFRRVASCQHPPRRR